jgi:hypothetical protein
VLFRDGVIVVAKLAHPLPPPTTWSSDFGRFARVVHVTGAFDVERAAYPGSGH